MKMLESKRGYEGIVELVEREDKEFPYLVIVDGCHKTRHETLKGAKQMFNWRSR